MKTKALLLALISLTLFYSAAPANAEHVKLQAINDTTPWQTNFVTCALCTSVAQSAIDYMKDLRTAKAAQGAIGMYCVVMGYNTTACGKVIGIFANSFLNNAFNLTVTASYICGPIMKTCTTPVAKTIKAYSDTKLADKATAIPDTSNNVVNNMYATASAGGRNRYQVLHLTDLNIDFNYVQGTNTNCGQTVCCQSKHGVSAESPAPQFGHKNCDTPSAAVTEMLRRIKTQYTPDVVLITGGLVTRDPFITEAQAVTYFGQALDIIKAAFPTTQTYVSLGETEFGPTRQYAFPATAPTGTTLLTAQFAAAVNARYGVTTPALPVSHYNTTAITEKGLYGYYTIMNLKNTASATNLNKVMLLSLNTQVCNPYNFALYGIKQDVANQLVWLENRLWWAKTQNLQVFIIGNLAPGGLKCNRQWSERFNILMERYQHVVRFMAFGGEGTDGYRILRSRVGTQLNPHNIIQIGGSMSTHTRNPSARVYIMDNEYNIPVSVNTIVFDLDEKNLDALTDWPMHQRIFSPTTYASSGITHIGPSSMLAFTTALKADSAIWLEVLKTHTKDLTLSTADCDATCQNDLYCKLYHGNIEWAMDCRNKFIDYEYGIPYIISLMSNPWID